MEDRNLPRRWSTVLMVAAVCVPLVGQSPGTASSDPRVKFKDGARYLSDLATALEMPRESICKELGLYDCYSGHAVNSWRHRWAPAALGWPVARSVVLNLQFAEMLAPLWLRISLSAIMFKDTV